MSALGRGIDKTLDNFVRRRAPPRRTPITLSRRRLYILPTRNGGLFAVLLLVMLLGATNYNNSLGFALTFWLGAIALVSMHHAHRNLVGLQVSNATAAPVFAGSRARFEITLVNDSGRVRRAVHVSAHDSGADEAVEVTAGTPATVVLMVAAPTRGRLACPGLRIESIYPMGLFRAWSWLQPKAETLVYPRCAGHERLPEPVSSQRIANRGQILGNDEFTGHRDYRRGDSTRHIDWKASARTDDLVMREYADPAAQTLWLDYNQVAATDHEARLSQLALWVIQAERAGLSYGLCLPGTPIGPDHGSAHQHACLRALALA